MAHCLMKTKSVPGNFWGEAVKTAIYLMNRAPTKSLDGKTPYEAWLGRKPVVKHLRKFGCVAYVKKLGPGLTKLSDRSVPGVFLGYEPGTKGYRVYDPINDNLMIARDILFDEKRAWNWGEMEAVVAVEIKHKECQCPSRLLLSIQKTLNKIRQQAISLISVHMPVQIQSLVML